LPKGQSLALILVTPKTTASLTGGMETVRLGIRADAAYLIEAGASNAQVSIVERLDTYETWLAREFPGEENLQPSDTLGARIPLIQRFAYGLDSNQPDPSGLPKLTRWTDGSVVLSFRKPLGVQGVSYRVDGAHNLMNWGGSSISMEPVAPPAGETDPQRVYYRLIGASGDSLGFAVIELDWEE
jgi:hypothetical protein